MILINDYYAAYIATMYPEGDRAGKPIISYKLQRSALNTIHEIKYAFKRTCP